MSATTTTTPTAAENLQQKVKVADKTTNGSFNYYTHDEDPEEDDLSLITGQNTNISPFKLPVHDIRGRVEEFNITNNSFQVLKHRSSLLPASGPSADFHDDALVRSVYWKETCDLMKKQFGARSAAIVNTSLREIPKEDVRTVDHKNPRKNPKSKSFGPFFIVHSDYTAPGARSHLRAITPQFFAETESEACTTAEERATFFRLRNEILEAEESAMKQAGVTDHAQWDGKNYKGPRYALFSIWRPLEPVKRDPLAIMDRRCIDPTTDLRGLPRVYRNRPGHVPEYKSTNALPKPPTDNNEHTWYYLPNQQTDEVFAIKFYDSDAFKHDDGSVGLICPHSAFELEGAENEPTRRSCELRAWVFW